LSVAKAEEGEVSEEPPEPIKEATVLYIGEAAEVVQQHVSVISGVPVDKVTAHTLSSFLRGKGVALTGDGAVKACRGAPSTMSNIKDAVERSRGAIDLMEDNKAMAYLTTAVGGIGCLGEALNGEQASELYFLKGFLEHATGHEEAARESFRLVHQLQSGLGWDTYFPPEAEPIFNEMAEAVAAAGTANLNMKPTPKAGSVWLDGNPAPVVGSQLRIPVGKHVLQFVGDKVITYELDVRAAGDLDLVIPGLLPASSMEWVASEEANKGYSDVFESIFEEGMVLYGSYEGSIWSTVIGSGEWSELVAQGAADQAEMLKSERYAKSPKVSGTALTSIAGTFLVTGLGTGFGSLLSMLDFSKINKQYKGMSGMGTENQTTKAAFHRNTVLPAQKKAISLGVVSGATTSVGGVSLGVAMSMFKKAKLRRAELPPWHPYAVNLMDESGGE
jgi:hypothetical protein